MNGEQTTKQHASEPTASSWSAFVEGFIEEDLSANPDRAVDAGRHEFDGRLPDWSREGLGREIDRLSGARDSAKAYDGELLDPDRRFEREHLLAEIDQRLFWLESAEWPWRNPCYYAAALDPSVYLVRDYAPLGERKRAYVEYARNVPRACGQIRANLRPPLPRPYVEIGIQLLGGLADFFELSVPPVFTPVRDDHLDTEFHEANHAAIGAMEELVEWLRAQPHGEPSDGFALGPELYGDMLRRTARVEASIDEVERAGHEDLERNMEALTAVCAEVSPGSSIAECVQRMRAVKPAAGSLEAAREQLLRLERFVRERDLVSIPVGDAVLVAEAPAFQRWNPAYISIPGPYENGVASTYYLTPPDPAWSTEERIARELSSVDLLFISAHEVWPGHHLQYLHASRLTSPVGRLFVSPSFAEGWAHYVEELVVEADLEDGDAEIRMGQLLNALLRNVRLLASIRLHSRGAEIPEIERQFRELAYVDDATARQQAARGTFDPGYLDYTLGKLIIRRLRQDWTSERGGRATWREFHDTLLSYGGPPLPLLRDELIGRSGGAQLF